MGRHDSEREAITGTSKAEEMKALWHQELLSNTGPLIEPTLDLITTRRKEQLDKKMERQRENVRVCESKKDTTHINHMSKRDENRKQTKKYAGKKKKREREKQVATLKIVT